MSTKSTLILLLIVAIASAGLTRYCFPQIETQTVEVTKEVIKVQDHIVTKIVTNPDGTTTTIVDETKNTTDNKVDKKTDTTYASKDWLFAVTGQVERFDTPTLVYGLHVQRRILGPFYLGGIVDQNKRVGLSIGMEF